MADVQAGTTGASGSGSTSVVISGNSSIGSGTKTVATPGTRVQLSSVSIPCKKLTIQAQNSNQGRIYIGDSTVASTNGIYVFNSQMYLMTPNNLNLVYLDCDNAGEGVVYLYEN